MHLATRHIQDNYDATNLITQREKIMSQNSTTQSQDQYRSPAEAAGDERLSATEAAVECLAQYSRERPEVVAMWAFGIGFVLGWKLKPW